LQLENILDPTMIDDSLLRTLVWTDYRLAVIFTVIVPLILLIWAICQRADAVTRLMVIYWRVASLFAIAIYILIPSWSLGFLPALLAKILTPLSLWFWVDINEEMRDLRQKTLKLWLKAWRWAFTFYCIVGIPLNIYPIDCLAAEDKLQTTQCNIWIEPATVYKQIFHANTKEGFLGFLGMTGLIIYGLYLLYFLVVRLAKQGRSALEQ
jgi:hypothetical protein